jgi:tetratricopeptide (TPR) repeat protein
MMNAPEMLQAHRYADAIALSQKRVAANPDDWEAVDTLASALRATGAYEEAVPLLERISAHEQQRTRGNPGRKLDIACLYWCMCDYRKAISLMHALVAGVLDRSINYGDLAGGVQQGLLLYYMGTTAPDPEAATFAVEYLRNRAKNTIKIKSWPGPPGPILFERGWF